MAIKHNFVSGKPDSSDPALVNPSDWNESHNFETPVGLGSGQSGVLLGTDNAGLLEIGAVHTLTPSQYLRRNAVGTAYEFGALPAPPEVVIPESPWIFAHDYDFAAQSPGGSLTAGITNTIILTPVPVGVSGTNGNHYLYISGGIGVAEAILITGGTATSGAASGTITFVPANNHSGAWTIKSATIGIQEAINFVGQNGQVNIKAGVHDVWAPFTVTSHVEIIGQGTESTILKNRAATTNVAQFFLPNMTTGTKSARIAHLSIIAGSELYSTTWHSTGAAIYVQGANHGMDIDHVVLKNHAVGIEVIDCLNVRICYFTMFYMSTHGIRYNATTDSSSAGLYISYGAISNFGRSGTHNPGGAGIYWRRGGAIFANFVDITSMPHGVLIQPAAATSAVYGFFTNVLADSNDSHGFVLDGSAVGCTLYTMHFDGCWSAYNGNANSVAPWESAAHGLVILGNGVDGVFWNGGRIRENGGRGVSIQGGINVRIHDAEIARNSQHADNVHAGIVVETGVSDFSIQGCLISNFVSTASNRQAWGIVIAPGASNNYMIIGNDLRNNVTGPIIDQGTGLNRIVKDNLGTDAGGFASIPSAASITLQTNVIDFMFITGSITITTITGGWVGRRIVLVFTAGAPGGVATGGNIAKTITTTQNQRITCDFDGSNWYCQ